MSFFTADPANPLGRRTGSLVGSGTHDEHSALEAGGLHDVDAGDETAVAPAQGTGAGATELTAWIISKETRSR